MTTVEDVRAALRHVVDPELRRDVVDLNMIRDVEIEDGRVSLKLALTTLACPLVDSLAEQVHRAVAALPGVQHVAVDVTEMSQEEVRQLFARAWTNAGGNGKAGSVPIVTSIDPARPATQSLARELSPIKHLIGITSGKGGVGKSMVTALLAVALQRHGYRVGIFDADITGASIPKIFGLSGNLNSTPEGIIPRQTAGGIKIVSANLMLRRPDDPVAWRGSRIAQLITELWRDVVWGPLDYLLIDFPPGTSDAQLTVMMDLPVQGLIMVTTPQELASLIVRKAVRMSQDMQVPLLGIIENMSCFVSPETGTRYDIFGPSHAEEVTQLAGVPLLARLPVDPALAQVCDAGEVEQYHTPLMDGVAQSIEVAVARP
jgi:Mrp family chromosome partitioning ATPase